MNKSTKKDFKENVDDITKNDQEKVDKVEEFRKNIPDGVKYIKNLNTVEKFADNRNSAEIPHEHAPEIIDTATDDNVDISSDSESESSDDGDDGDGGYK